MKRLVTVDHVQDAHASGRGFIDAPVAETIVTPAAFSKASELGVVIAQNGERGPVSAAVPAAAERVLDASGVTVVRGASVRLEPFAAAGPGKSVGLSDVITKRDGSPMGAGIMSYGRNDSFEWNLTYDEIDYVLEGTLEIRIDGRSVSGTAGDIFYIPKGSRIVFATPDRVRIFYVTHPADWAG